MLFSASFDVLLQLLTFCRQHVVARELHLIFHQRSGLTEQNAGHNADHHNQRHNRQQQDIHRQLTVTDQSHENSGLILGCVRSFTDKTRHFLHILLTKFAQFSQ